MTATDDRASSIDRRPPTLLRDAKIKPLDRIRSTFTGKPCPRAQLGNASAMVAEQNRIGVLRPAEVFSAIERNLRTTMQTRVNKSISTDTEHQLEPIVAAVRVTVQERNTLLRDVDNLDGEPLVGPHGESVTTSEARQRHDELDDTIAAANRGGGTKHRRIPPRMRRFIERLVWLDLPLFIYFMASSLNVSLTRFYETVGGNIRMAFAVIFGLFATIAVARGLKFFGSGHRAYKDDQGQWAGPPQLRPERLLVFGIIGGVAALMAFRVGSDILDSGMGIALAVVVAAVLAIASALLNYSVYAAEFRDGSADTERLDAYAGEIERIDKQKQSNRARIIILDEDIERNILMGFRVATQIRSENWAAAIGSPEDRAIRFARAVHQGAGYTGEICEPELDWSPLDTALRHLSTLEAEFLADREGGRR